MNTDASSVGTIVTRTLIAFAAVALAGALVFDDYGGFERLRMDEVRLLDEPVPGGLSVLFVGNSHTYHYDIPFIVERLAAADPGAAPMFVDMAADPGVTLSHHVAPGSRARAIAGSREWDVIILQNRSHAVLDPEVFAAELDASVRAFEPHARRVVLYQTWAWGEQGGAFGRRPGGTERMNALVMKTYEDGMTAHPGLEGAPVGGAFARVRQELRLPVTGGDGNHLNDVGAFVASCVVFTSITSRPCPETADRLRVRLETRMAADLLKLLRETPPSKPLSDGAPGR